ncbi:hypothetical protein GJ744_002387 [Endocarpon pusillum]|uniref:Uncharacterized protein n=1 Tax=Endocarpon pusillum TaxID=364733 RepID=A0A8H7AW53_9EURO|nr:hypothetical protein GJ744_002387 [Endocarpon pusillum]
MALVDRPGRRSSELSLSVLTSTESTVRSNDACKPDDTTIKHATIVDIDVQTAKPREGLTFQRPLVKDLTRRGPAQIMNGAKQHKVSLRWVHLRANCMSWIEELMARVCEERGMAVPESSENSPMKNPLLRKDLWADLFHGKASDQIQSRFMGPTCIQFSSNLEDEMSDTNGSTGGSRDNLVLYLPFLHWESYDAWREREDLTRSISANKPGKPQPDRDFVAEYLHHGTAPFHDRRSLHQAYYHDFGLTRPLPQYKQVMQSFTSQTHPDSVKMMVVDQLWLWVIKGTGLSEEGSQPDLVVTAFPDRFNGVYDSANVYNSIIEHLERGLQPPLRTANNLVAAILEHCTGVFFQRQLEHDKWFVEFFAAAIGAVRNRQKLAFSDFCLKSRELKDLEDQEASLAETVGKLEDAAFSISVETSLVQDIKDIIDELSCVDYILHRQQDVVASLLRSQNSRSLKTIGEMVKERRDTWASIAKTAHVAYDEIQTQMDAQESARYGRTVLLLTVVTIIFLPMSFLATWFGMNVKDPDAGNLPLYQIAAIVFPISIAIALFALVVAFSEKLRDFIVAGVRDVLDFVLGTLGINRSRNRRRRQKWRMNRRQQDIESGTVGDSRDC